jgi:hypothetical protein
MDTVGDPLVFAIEWDVTWRQDSQIHGYLCFWVHGVHLGECDEDVLLSATTAYLRAFLSHGNERHIATLEGKSKEEIYAYIHDSVYAPIDDDDSRQHALTTYVAPHDLEDWSLHGYLRQTFHLNDIGGSAFSRLGPILVNEESRHVQRLIWHDTTLHEALLPGHTFDEVSQQYLDRGARDLGP